MTKNELREKVIKGLDCCKDIHTAGAGNAQGCIECQYNHTQNDGMNGYPCIRKLFNDALELLQTQEPRVMTLDEVQVSIDPVWLEGGMAGGTWAMMPFTREYSIEFVADGVCTVYPAFAIGEYGKTWRCWTSRPTDEQREAIPWN